VKIDGNWVFWEGNFNTPDHENTKVITSTGDTAEFSIWDSHYDDNSGTITV